MSYRTIFTVVSEHSSSTVTARYAIALAACCKARLVLYAAHNDLADEAVRRHTDHHLDHLLAVAVDRDIPVTQIVETGTLERTLPKRVTAEAADLVFYPLYPGESYGAPLQQQTVHKLLRTVSTGLAIMRIMHMGKPHPGNILVPLGASINDLGCRAVFIAALANCYQARVTLFHRTGMARSYAPEDYRRLCNELRKHHLDVLERSGLGPIAKAVALEAISHHSDLIVLGASERGSLQRLFFGNPAGDIMHHPPCNAVLFRAAT